MKILGHPNYLSQDEESLIVALADIKDVHGLNLYYRGISEQLQRLVKASNTRRGDNKIIKKTSLSYLCGVIKNFNERKDDNEIQTRKLRTGLVKV